MKRLLIILMLATGCAPVKDIKLRITGTKGGYTYAVNRYMVYRAKLDSQLAPGTIITAHRTLKDTGINIFRRIR